MKYIKAKNIKVGENYYFVDDDFHYSNVRCPRVSKERINKIIGNEYSTKNDGDRYEVQRFIGFKTEAEAVKYSIRELKQFKKWLLDDVNKVIKSQEEKLSTLEIK